VLDGDPDTGFELTGVPVVPLPVVGGVTPLDDPGLVDVAVPLVVVVAAGAQGGVVVVTGGVVVWQTGGVEPEASA
jgi:hypothetical protein